MRIIAITEVVRIIVDKTRKIKSKPSKRRIRLQKERACFEGMKESLKKDGTPLRAWHPTRQRAEEDPG